MDYAYEALGQTKFLQLCHALAAKSFPDTPLLSLGPESSEAPAPAGGFTLVHAIYIAHPHAPDARSRLALTLEGDLPEVRRRVEQGARAFLFLTNVPGSTSMRATTGDRVRKLLAPLPVPVEYWWRDTLDARLDPSFALKLAYSELLPPLSADTALLRRQIGALRSFIQTQSDTDRWLPFAPPDRPADLLDLFVDLPARMTEDAPHRSERPLLAAQALLDPEFVQKYPTIVLEGGPGQGKSTILRYVCQIHRMRLLGGESDTLPLRVELRDLSAWLLRSTTNRTERLESYLARLIHQAGAESFTPADLMAVLQACPLLLALDGLDEVGDPAARQRLMTTIATAIDRLKAEGLTVQVIITTRPSCYTTTAPYAAPLLRLQPLDDAQVTALMATRQERGVLSPEDGERLRSVLVAQPATAELARTPMEAELLCHLVRSRLPEIPTRRASLYGAYVESCLRRVTGTDTEEPTSLDLHTLLAQHGLLAWQAHADAESNALADGLMPEAAQLDAIQRASLLVRTADGRFRFGARSLREYLTARYLFDALPPDDKPDEAERFAVLAQNPYWLNVSRFYAGLVHRAYLPQLTTTLAALAQDEAYKGSSYPYLLSLLLLADQVFVPQPKTLQSALALCIAGLRARRWRVDEWLDRGWYLPLECGGRDLARATMALLGELPPDDEASLLIHLVRKHAVPSELAHWWRNRLWSAVGLELDRWIAAGEQLGLLPALTPEELDRLLPVQQPESPPALRPAVVRCLVRAGHGAYLQQEPDRAARLQSALVADVLLQRPDELEADSRPWWEDQFARCKTAGERSRLLALFAAQAEGSVITALWRQYQEMVDTLDDEARDRITQAIRGNSARASSEADRFAVTYPDEASPAAVSLLRRRLTPDQLVHFYRSHLMGYQGIDPAQSELCATAALTLILAEDPAWSDALSTLRSMYARDITPDMTTHRGRPLAQPIAEAVLTEPGIYPMSLVYLAREAQQAQSGGKVTPVALTVQNQGWFAQKGEYLN